MITSFDLVVILEMREKVQKLHIEAMWVQISPLDETDVAQ